MWTLLGREQSPEIKSYKKDESFPMALGEAKEERAEEGMLGHLTGENCPRSRNPTEQVMIS